jgi:hypothetical protein
VIHLRLGSNRPSLSRVYLIDLPVIPFQSSLTFPLFFHILSSLGLYQSLIDGPCLIASRVVVENGHEFVHCVLPLGDVRLQSLLEVGYLSGLLSAHLGIMLWESFDISSWRRVQFCVRDNRWFLRGSYSRTQVSLRLNFQLSKLLLLTLLENIGLLFYDLSFLNSNLLAAQVQ